jgi:hypothetical protein
MPSLKINENQFKHICQDAKVPCRYSFVAGTAKQEPYVLIEWDNRANHVHVELQKMQGGKYYRVTGDSPSTAIYNFEMTGFHVKLKDVESVHDYMGFTMVGAGVWDPAWSHRQSEDRQKGKFTHQDVGKDDAAFLLQIGRSFIKDLGTVTGTKQTLGHGFETL